MSYQTKHNSLLLHTVKEQWNRLYGVTMQESGVTKLVECEFKYNR